jgi:hypothetical protein
VPVSERLGIKDELLAWNLENAVSLRLLKFDREVAEQSARLVAYEVSKIFGDPKESEPDDPSIDASTEVW